MINTPISPDVVSHAPVQPFSSHVASSATHPMITISMATRFPSVVNQLLWHIAKRHTCMYMHINMNSIIARCVRIFLIRHQLLCADYDECAAGEHVCHSQQQCVNTRGAYTCMCPRGFRSAGPGLPCTGKSACSRVTDQLLQRTTCAHIVDLRYAPVCWSATVLACRYCLCWPAVHAGSPLSVSDVV